MNAEHLIADELDAQYLRCQLKTNGVIMQYKAMMQQALNRLHQHLIEVSEEASDVIPQAPVVHMVLPRLDTTSSRPRSHTPTVAEAEELTRQLAELRAAR